MKTVTQPRHLFWIVALVLCAFSTTASAQQVAMPNIGARHIMLGTTAQPGLVFGAEAESPYEDALSYGQMLHIGVMQLLNRQFAMSAGVDIGSQFMDEHGASLSGRADSEFALALSFGLQGRWLPSNTMDGPMLAMGLEYFRAGLADAPAQIMSINAMTGWLFWTNENNMALVELGYHFPLIQGLSVPSNFGTSEQDPVAEWSWHRVSLSIRWSY